MKNAYLQTLQRNHSAAVASMYSHLTTEETPRQSAEVKQLQSISQIFAGHSDQQPATDILSFDKPLLFTLAKDTEEEIVERYDATTGAMTKHKQTIEKTYVMVIVGSTQDLKNLRTTRLEGEVENTEGAAEKPYGVFSAVALLGKDDEETNRLKAGLKNRYIRIDQLDLAKISMKDVARIFKGAAVLADQPHFRGTQFYPQVNAFVKKYPKIEQTLKLIQLYNGIYPRNIKSNFYGELLSSVDFLNHYQSIAEKPEGLPISNSAADIAKLARFLPNVEIKEKEQDPAPNNVSATEVTSKESEAEVKKTSTFADASTAEADVANNLIADASRIRGILKLDTTATHTQIAEAVSKFDKQSSLTANNS